MERGAKMKVMAESVLKRRLQICFKSVKSNLMRGLRAHTRSFGCRGEFRASPHLCSSGLKLEYKEALCVLHL